METAIDRAWGAAMAEGAGDAEMARFYDLFAATEFMLLIDPETMAGEGAPQPMLFPVEGVRTALIFDLPTRLADFAPEGAHLSLSGRAVVEMFVGKEVQLGLNLGDAPSATLLPASAVSWAAQALTQPIEEVEARPATLTAPHGATPEALAAIDMKLAALGAVWSEAWLCGGEGGLLLCISLAVPEAERATVRALAETARFAGGETAAFDIAVLAEEDPRLAAARKTGLGFSPSGPAVEMEAGPGMDKSKPPILR